MSLEPTQQNTRSWKNTNKENNIHRQTKNTTIGNTEWKKLKPMKDIQNTDNTK